MNDLIYDIGMHDGEDSEFYLRKGFRVIAVEADPALCRAATGRFHEFVETGQLTIVNRAITRRSGAVTFYKAAVSDWGTVVPEWKEDMEARGVMSEPILVEGITLAALIEKYGPAFYTKLDIEGMDRSALESLATTPIRPNFVSIETTFSRQPSLPSIEADFATLVKLGYKQFKIVDQYSVPEQVPPRPALAGRYLPFRFPEGASGLFGEGTPGEWKSAAEALGAFKRIQRTKWLQRRLYRKPRIYPHYCSIAFRLTGERPNLGWYDIHAKHHSVE